jgi:hypothetical protein
MKRRDFIALVGTVAIGWALPARAEPPRKTYRLGYLGTARFPNLIEALQTGLRELGYVDGMNLPLSERRPGRRNGARREQRNFQREGKLLMT